MNIKELNKLFYIKKDIKQLEEQLAELNNLGSAPLSDMPKGTNTSDPTQKFVEKKEKIITKLNKAYTKYVTEYEKINDFIESIDDTEVKLIARLRFIKHLDWFDIAEEISPRRKSIHWTTPRKKIVRYLEKKKDREA